MGETTMKEGSSLRIGSIPDCVSEAATAHGFSNDTCIFSLASDLDISGRDREVWLLVTETHVAAFDAVDGLASGPFPIADADKIRTFQGIGSAFLQLRVNGLYVDLLRYSNARREFFGRAKVLLEWIRTGREFDPSILAAPGERVCHACGLPISGKGAPCARCQGGRGIFYRSLMLMRPYKPYILGLLAMMVARVGLGLLPPYLTSTLVDKVLVPRENHDLLITIVAILVGAAAMQGVLNVFIGRTSSFIGTRITRDLRETLQRKFLSLGVDYYDRHSVGTLMSRVLYDVDYFQGFVNQVAEGFLLNLMMVVGIGSMLFYMNAYLAVLVLVPIPFVIIGTIFFWKHIYPRYYRLWDSYSKTAQLLSGLLSGIRLVKVFGQERREQERFADSAQHMQSARRSLEMSTATFNPIMAFIFGLGGIIIWYAGGRLVLRETGDPEHITLGVLMAFLGYIGMFYGPVSALSMFSNWFSGFITAAQRIFEVLDAVPSIAENPHALQAKQIQGRIELRNVTFGYDPYTPIIKDVSLSIAPGQFIGIVGKSGSGKSTLVNLICRFYDPQQGTVRIDDMDVRDMDAHDLHSQVALVLQEPFLFRARIEDNLAYGKPDASPLEIIDAARAANAHEFISRMPGGYDTRLGERGAGISGGERQRVTIARALIRDPRILILDEATSSVDTESEQEIQKALATLGRGRTTIVIAHRLSTLKTADYIYVVEEGRIAEEGTHDSLLARQGIYHNLVMIQTELSRLEI